MTVYESGLNVVILGNRQSDTTENPGLYPAYLAERNGVSVIQRIMNSCEKIDNANVIFSVLEEDASQFKLNEVLKQLLSRAVLRITPNLTKGSACTALLAACQMNQENELLILSANEIVDIDLIELISNFQSKDFDAATVVFHSTHPRYSYVQIEDEKYISEIAQRDPISNIATTGLFWFKKTSDFVYAAKKMILFRAPIRNNYYVGLSINELILDGKKIGFQKISESSYIPLKDHIQSTNYQIGVMHGEV